MATWSVRLAWTLLAAQLLWTTAAAAAEPLACGVEGTSRPVQASEVCRALGRALGRPIAIVDDARKVARGDALQVIQEDVEWIVVWLVDSHVRSWTRVSKIEAAPDQLRFLARAARALAELSPPPPKRACVRVDPDSRSARSPDLIYPWAELRPCRRRLVEVVDPWWLPGNAAGARRRPAS